MKRKQKATELASRDLLNKASNNWKCVVLGLQDSFWWNASQKQAFNDYVGITRGQHRNSESGPASHMWVTPATLKKLEVLADDGMVQRHELLFKIIDIKHKVQNERRL